MNYAPCLRLDGKMSQDSLRVQISGCSVHRSLLLNRPLKFRSPLPILLVVSYFSLGILISCNVTGIVSQVTPLNQTSLGI